MKKFSFLSLKLFLALAVEEAATYLAQFEAWLADFKKAAEGDALTIKLPITNINVDVNDEGFMAVIVAKAHALMNNVAFTFKPTQLDVMAKAFQLPNIEVVADIIASCTEPSFLVIDLRPVNKGDIYHDYTDGIDKEYQCPALRTENARFEFSEEATELIADLLKERMRHAMLNATGRRRTTKAVVKDKMPVTDDNTEGADDGVNP